MTYKVTGSMACGLPPIGAMTCVPVPLDTQKVSTPAKRIVLFAGDIFPQEGNCGPGRPGLGRPRLLWLTEVSQTQSIRHPH